MKTKTDIRDRYVIIMAGGKGKRMWPLTRDIPKPMVEVGGKPILEGRFKPSGAIGKPADFTCFPRWRMLLSKSGINRFSGSHFIYLDYDWGWNYSLMQPLTGTVEVFEDGIPGLPRGKYTFDPLTTDVIGAFRIAIPFEWVPPFRRAELDPMEPLKPACPVPPPPVEPPSSESSAGTSRK